MFSLRKLKLTRNNYMSIQYVLFAFILLYIVLVFNNYENLDIETKGQISFFLVVGSITLFFLYVLTTNSRTRHYSSDYFKTGAIITLFLSIFLLFSSYDKYEIRDNFLTDPVNIGIIILFIFCLLNVFDEEEDYDNDLNTVINSSSSSTE